MEDGQSQLAGQRRGMAGTAGATLVHRIGLCAGAVLGRLLDVLCRVVVMVRTPVSMLMLDMVASPRQLGGHFCHRIGVPDSTEDHGRRCVPLEGYGEHHDPKNKQANPVHAKHLDKPQTARQMQRLHQQQVRARKFVDSSP